jgi:hypothetical protein
LFLFYPVCGNDHFIQIFCACVGLRMQVTAETYSSHKKQQLFHVEKGV